MIIIFCFLVFVCLCALIGIAMVIVENIFNHYFKEEENEAL